MVEGELPIEKLVLTIGAETELIDWKVTLRPDGIAIKPI
jgi:hypothetical protein